MQKKKKRKKKSELALTIRLILEVSISKTEMKVREIETGWGCVCREHQQGGSPYTAQKNAKKNWIKQRMVCQEHSGSAKTLHKKTLENVTFHLSKREQDIACLGGLNSSLRKENGTFTEKVRAQWWMNAWDRTTWWNRDTPFSHCGIDDRNLLCFVACGWGVWVPVGSCCSLVSPPRVRVRPPSFALCQLWGFEQRAAMLAQCRGQTQIPHHEIASPMEDWGEREGSVMGGKEKEHFPSFLCWLSRICVCSGLCEDALGHLFSYRIK